MSTDNDISSYINNGTIDIDSVAGVSERVKPGEYVAKLTDYEGKQSKRGNGMVQARFEIVKTLRGDPDAVGMDAVAFYSMIILAPKKKGQHPFAPGIVEMKMAFAAVGAPFTGGFPVDPEKAAREVAKRLGNKLVRILITEEKKKETDESGNEIERVNARVRVLGLADGHAAATTSSSDDDIV